MRIQFYNNLSETNVVNKSLEVIGSEIPFTFKDDNSILFPVLILKNYSGGNYCYIQELNKYYYVKEIVLKKNKTYEIHLTIDVLKTYSNEIENAKLVSPSMTIIENNIVNEYYKENAIFIKGN